MKDLQGKVAVVTGGGSGIGRATCLALAGQGARVAVSDLNAQSAHAVAAELVAAGGRATGHTLDVSDDSAVHAFRDDVLTTYGVVDILVNSAGIAVDSVPTTETDLKVYRRVADVNLWGAVHTTLHFLPHLLTRPAANVVNVASFAALMGTVMMSPYSISKFGLRGFTEAMQMEYLKGPVYFTLVHPGGTRTPIMRNSPGIDAAKRDVLDRGLRTSKLAKPPEHVAAAIVKAIRNDTRRVLVGPDTRAVDIATRLFPGSYQVLMAPALRKFIERTLKG